MKKIPIDVLAVVFALKNKEKNLRDYNRSFVEYYYSLPRFNKIDMSSMWGKFYREWDKIN